MIICQKLDKDYYPRKSKKEAQTTNIVHALKDINLTIEAGEFMSLAGPSGSGKTTLLNLIGCLDSPTRGHISLDNQDIGKHSSLELAEIRKNKLGFIFQSYNLIPVLTAFENVSFALSIQGRSEGEAKDTTMRILEKVGLADMAHRRPDELSGGQQQRVAVARALVKNPKVVLADEPTANLDSKTGESILQLMKNLNQDIGVTFVFSTHDQMVMDYADRLVMLHDGQIAEDKRRA